MAILITGGTGYIGTHTCIELVQAGYEIIVFDNLVNSSIEPLRRVESIVGRNITFIQGDIRSKNDLTRVFNGYDISAVIHFAGLKSVGESVDNPLTYYDNNVSGTVILCQVMSEFNCKKIVFSSSATVYGKPKSLPIKEEFSLSATNPYGRSKLITEDILRDVFQSDESWSIALLRYFNPVGAHASGLIGEAPNGVPNNLMPYISQVAVGVRDKLHIFGNDYATHDGSGVRDYIHVVDLAKGHVKALKAINEVGVLTVNLGTGVGYSVLDLVKAFEKVSGNCIPYEIVDRRPGDIDSCFSDPSYAKLVLDWQAELSLEQMCIDTWRWQSKNPRGYI